MAAHFEKCLTETELTSTLALPLDWLSVLPPFEQGSNDRIYVSDGSRYWEFRYFIRRIGHHLKPVLRSEGWLNFVNHKGLNIGDKIILDYEVNNFIRAEFRIRAQKLNIEGDQWVDV